MRVYVILDERSSPDHPLGDAVETFIRREDAERFIEEVRRDESELASYLRIEERERVRIDLGALDDEREAVDGDHHNRVALVGSRVAASLPDLPAELHLTVRAAGR